MKNEEPEKKDDEETAYLYLYSPADLVRLAFSLIPFPLARPFFEQLVTDDECFTIHQL